MRAVKLQCSHHRTASTRAGRAQAKGISKLVPFSFNRRQHTAPSRCNASGAAAESLTLQGDGGDGNNGSGSDGKGGNGGSGGEGGNSNGEPIMDPATAAVLASANRTATSFPQDFALGLTTGKVGADTLQRYLELEATFFVSWLMQFPGFRERLLADPSFLVKVAIEVGIGLFSKVSAEYTKRQSSFFQEMDFVTANTMMALIADFMLVWLPAPTLSFKAKAAAAAASPFARIFANCPDNAFQKVQPGMQPFTLGQRALAVLRNGTKLMGVGFCASMIGVVFTNVLTMLRSSLDTGAAASAQQDVVATSLAYGLYMATSSNLRYQILAGVVEERGIETVFAGRPQVCHALSLTVRTLNTFLGSLLWVDFVRLLGIQPPAAH